MAPMNGKCIGAKLLRRVLCAALLVAALGPCAALAGGVTARFVPDGDTLMLTDGRSVRLMGIDSPEKGRDGAPDQYCADMARARLDALTRGRALTLEPGPRGHDRFGRVLAVVRLDDGTNLNETMVREGLAFVYTVPGEWPELARALLAAQNEALDAGRGFWPRILALPQAGRPWVGNARSLRAFPEGSPEAGSLARRNRVPLANLEAVFRQGFCPARQVSPWPTEQGGPRRSPSTGS